MLQHMLLFGVFASNHAPFLGPNMLQRGDYLNILLCGPLYLFFFFFFFFLA